MDLQSFSFLFNRALSLTFIKKKLMVAFCILALNGLLVTFFRGLSSHASEWMHMSLTFLPLFLCIGILLSGGIFLIRIYYHEVKKQEKSYKEIFKNSWEILLGASYFTIPLLISYMILWVLLGVFVLLKQTPGLGSFLSVILAFAPFLIYLGILILYLISLFLLFYVAPAIAFKGLEKGAVFQTVMKRLEVNPFFNILLLIMALLPFGFILILLFSALTLTGCVANQDQALLQTTLQRLFVMIPFVALLTPAVIFFFNFAAESYMFMQKHLRHLS